MQNPIRITVSAPTGTDPYRIDAAALNDELKAAALVCDGFHDAVTAIVVCEATDDAAVRAVIAAHIANTVAREAAKVAAKVAAKSIDDAVAADTTLAAFKAMDNAQFDAWWAANVTNAAQAIGVLKRLAKIVIRRL